MSEQREALAERRAPVNGSPHGTIAWSEHEEAWRAYHRNHSRQDAETIALRGGFGVVELVTQLGRMPLTWQPDGRTQFMRGVTFKSDALAQTLADAEQRGADRVAAAVEAVALNLDRGDSIDRGIATDLRAALIPGAADRVRAEARVDFSRLNYGICPKCGEDKFIGHGPWCIDCFTNGGA